MSSFALTSSRAFPAMRPLAVARSETVTTPARFALTTLVCAPAPSLKIWCQIAVDRVDYTAVDEVTPNEIARTLCVTGLTFRNWLRSEKVAGHPLLAGHEYPIRYRFTRREADQLTTDTEPAAGAPAPGQPCRGPPRARKARRPRPRRVRRGRSPPRADRGPAMTRSRATRTSRTTRWRAWCCPTSLGTG